MLKISLGVVSAILMTATVAQATAVAVTTREINIAVSRKSGHLLDWSKTSQRIQLVFIEAPEEAMEKVTFSVPGCKKDGCGGDSSLMLINSRKGKTSGTAVLRVVTIGKRGARAVYRIKIKIINEEVPSGETETEFQPNEIRVRPTVVEFQLPAQNISR
jgi:hypothetical protein